MNSNVIVVVYIIDAKNKSIFEYFCLFDEAKDLFYLAYNMKLPLCLFCVDLEKQIPIYKYKNL